MRPCTRCTSLYLPVGACHTDEGLCPRCSGAKPVALPNALLMDALRGRGPRTAADVAGDLNVDDAVAKRELERLVRANLIISAYQGSKPAFALSRRYTEGVAIHHACSCGAEFTAKEWLGLVGGEEQMGTGMEYRQCSFCDSHMLAARPARSVA